MYGHGKEINSDSCILCMARKEDNNDDDDDGKEEGNGQNV